ncbi:MAG: B12-binding domain-containing radical SAM protein [Pirellulales bacterium]|nr:B12-binding domain-containing radical SAM protein [Pirellulales bacterium]
MQIVLWDTRKMGVSKDFAGGMGVGRYPVRSGIRDRLIRHFYDRDRRPVALLYAHLAAIFRQLGHEVRYFEDAIPGDADVYVFNPSLITLQIELEAIAQARHKNPSATVLVVGLVASVMPEAFEELGVTVVKGEAEQLLWTLDEVLDRPGVVVNLGTIEDLDSIPLPDWSLFGPSRFRIGYDFWKFPTVFIQHSRGCSFKCNYCPYIVLENNTRFRNPEAVVDEIRHDMQQWGFRSFKFRDPLFGLDRKQVYRLAELIGRLPRRIQFSIETRIDLMRPEILRVLKRVGLTSITVGIESPDESTLEQYRRAAINSDRQRDFVSLCRSMGIRTVAGFLIGFPEDTVSSVRSVLNYAKLVGPTYANFNVVTPYPGTEFFEQIKDKITDFDYSHYDVYTPVLKYNNMSTKRMAELHGKCFRQYYFDWSYLATNAHLLWPILQRFRIGRAQSTGAESDVAHSGPPKPKTPSGLELFMQKKGLRKDGPHHRKTRAKGRSNQDQTD